MKVKTVKQAVQTATKSRLPVPGSTNSGPPEVVGDCPECGRGVIKGQKFYFCSGSTTGNCIFKIPNYCLAELGLETISIQQMKQLLNGDLVKVWELISQREGNPKFDCWTYLNFDKERGYWQIKFLFNNFDEEALSNIRRTDIMMRSIKRSSR